MGTSRRLKDISKITPRKQKMLSCFELDWYEWYDGWFHYKTDSHQRKNWSRIYKINHRRKKRRPVSNKNILKIARDEDFERMIKSISKGIFNAKCQSSYMYQRFEPIFTFLIYGEPY